MLNIKKISIDFEDIAAILDFLIQILQKIGKPRGRGTFFWRSVPDCIACILGTSGWWSREKTLCHIGTLSQRRESLVQWVVPARLFSGLAEIADFC